MLGLFKISKDDFYNISAAAYRESDRGKMFESENGDLLGSIIVSFAFIMFSIKRHVKRTAILMNIIELLWAFTGSTLILTYHGDNKVFTVFNQSISIYTAIICISVVLLSVDIIYKINVRCMFHRCETYIFDQMAMIYHELKNKGSSDDDDELVRIYDKLAEVYFDLINTFRI